MVVSAYARSTYSTNGSTTVFAFTFEAFSTSEVAVRLRTDSDGSEILLVETTDYTVSLNGSDPAVGGTVTTVSTYATGKTLVVYRASSQVQATDLVTGGVLPADTIEDQFDKLQMQIQELQRQIDRSLKYPITDASSLASLLDNSVDRASKNLTFDSNGNAAVSASVASGSVSFTTFGENLVGSANALAGKAVTNLDHLIDVRDYGAIGDGATDDTAAIQSALDASAGTIFFPKGTYMISGLTVNGQRKIKGVGYGDSILKMIANSDTDMLANTAANNALITIEDIKLDGNAANQASGNGITFTQVNIGGMRNVWITNCKDYGIYLDTCNHFSMKDCYVSLNLGTGYYSTQSENCNLIDCVVESNTTAQVHKVSTLNIHVGSILGCWFETDGTLAPTDHIILDCSRVTISGCVFKGLNVANSLINLKTGATGNIIRGNAFPNPASGDVSILIDSGAFGNICENNLGGAPITTDNDGRNYIFEFNSTSGFHWMKRGRVAEKEIAFSADDTTPSIRNGNLFIVGTNTAEQAITTFDDSVAGQIFTVRGSSDTYYVTIADANPFWLSDGPVRLGARDTITFLCAAAGSFYEVSRSINTEPFSTRSLSWENDGVFYDNDVVTINT